MLTESYRSSYQVYHDFNEYMQCYLNFLGRPINGEVFGASWKKIGQRCLGRTFAFNFSFIQTFINLFYKALNEQTNISENIKKKNKS